MVAPRGTSQGSARKTIGGANCRLEGDGTVQCDFGPRDPAERQQSGNPGAGCYVNTGTERWECPSMPELHGQPANINSVHRDPMTGQTWASIGERKIQVPSFPVSVGRRHRASISRMAPSGSRKRKCGKGKVWSPTQNKCVKRRIVLAPDGDPLPKPNPMTIAREGVVFSPPATSRQYAGRVTNKGRRRAGRMGKSSRRSPTCEETCAAQHVKGSLGYQNCVTTRCATIGVPRPGSKPQPSRTRRRRRNQPQTAAPTGSIGSTITEGPRTPPGNGNGGPSGPGNKWNQQDAVQAGCCVFLDGQGAYLTCDPPTAGGNHPLHGLEVQVQAVQEDAGIITVCHQIFTEQCWRLPMCPEEKTPSTCCVEVGQYERDGITFNGRLKCTDPNDELHGILVMTGTPYDKNGETYVSFDVGGDVTSELPVCERPKIGFDPSDDQPGPNCCVIENPDGSVTLICDPDPYGWNGQTIPGAQCMDTANGRMCALEFTDPAGNQVQIEAPVCEQPPEEKQPPHCCVDATTTPPTLQQCSDPSYNGTPVKIIDVDEPNGQVMVAVPWSSTPVPMPLCDKPPEIEIPPTCCVDATTMPPTLQQCSDPSYNGKSVNIIDVDEASGQVLVSVPWSSTPVPMPLCDKPPEIEIPPGEECPSCPPGHWMSPDGRCVQCPPGQLIDPTTGQCITCPKCPPPGECPTCPPGTYLDTATGQCVTCPECPPCEPPDYIPPWECCDEDEDCNVSPGPRMPHLPQPGSVPSCEPCCEDCAVTGAGTVANPCNPCRANRR